MTKAKIKKPLFIFLVIFLSLGACLSLFKAGYFSMHDDLQIMRLFEMEKCFLDGQIPCRWIPDMGAGFGYPLFNFYSVFPYYFGMIFRILGLSFVDITKLLFGISLVSSGVFMYLLAKEFFGKLGGIISAVFFIYAPYRAVDIYVRGAMGETWGITFFPIVFFSLYKFIKEEKLSWFILSIFSLSFLFISHNIMTLIFTPFIILWCIFWLAYLKKTKVIIKLFFVFLGAVGVSAFFLLPSFFEKSLVNISSLTSDYFDFHLHFAGVSQLFLSRFWGYGPSVLGPNDQMSFQIGIIHWPLALLVGAISVLTLFFKRKKELFLPILLLFFWLFSIFMTHSKSVFLWDNLPLISFVQFPWRFLGLTAFFGSFLVGGLVLFFKKINWLLVLLFTVSVIALNFQYFKPEFYYPNETDESILSGDSWKIQSMGAILDYLPKDVQQIPQELAPANPWVIAGTANISEFAKRSNFWRFTIETTGNQTATVVVPVFNFPRWDVLIDQKLVGYKSNNPTGATEIEIPPGKHTVVGWFVNTPLRDAANGITLFSLAALILLVLIKEKTDEKIH